MTPQLRPYQQQGIAQLREAGIYRLYWPKQGYFYYGQSNNLHIRKLRHFRALKDNKHYNKFVQRVFNSYGEPEFQIVELCELTNLDNREQFYISANFNNKLCCNASPSAGYSQRGIKRSQETKNKISISKTGIKHSESVREDARKRMNKRYAEGFKVKPLIGELNGFYGRKHSEETKSKWKGRSNNFKGDKNPKARIVVNTQTGIFYTTIKDAAKSISNYSESTLKKFLQGQRVNKTNLVYA